MKSFTYERADDARRGGPASAARRPGAKVIAAAPISST
jgi:hypothetical protein